jgi:tetratricopeptide (TPR) repeat protein
MVEYDRTDELAMGFVFALTIPDKQAYLSRLDEQDRDAIDDALAVQTHRAANDEARGFFTWSRLVLNAIRGGGEEEIAHAIRAGLGQRLLIEPDDCERYITAFLDSALPEWRHRGANLLAAGGEFVLAYLEARRRANAGEPGSILSVAFLAGKAHSVSTGDWWSSLVPLAVPVQATEGNAQRSFVIANCVSDALESHRADIAAAAVLAATARMLTGLGEDALAIEHFALAEGILGRAGEDSYDHAYLLARIEEGEGDPAKKVGLLDQVIGKLEALAAAYSDRCPVEWLGDLAYASMHRGIARRALPRPDLKQAVVDHTQAINTWDAIKTKGGAELRPTWRQANGLAYMNRANASREISSTEAKSALEDYHQAIVAFESLREEEGPGSLEERLYMLAMAYINRASAYRHAGNPDPGPALSDLDRAVEILEQLNASHPVPLAWREALAQAYGSRANMRKPARGEAYDPADHDRAISVLEAIVNNLGDGTPPNVRNDLAGALSDRAIARPVSAASLPFILADHDRSVKLREALVAEYGVNADPRWRRDLSISYKNRGGARNASPSHDQADALADYDRSIEIAEGVVASLGVGCPSEWIRSLASAYSARSKMRDAMPALGASHAILDASREVALRKQLVESLGPNCPVAWKFELADALKFRSQLCRATLGHGNAAALSDCDQALAIIQEVVATCAPTEHLDWWESLASALMNKGVALENMGDQTQLPDVLDLYDKSIAIRTRIVAWASKDASLQRWTDLAVSYMNRGNSRQRAMHLGQQDPIADYDAAISIYRTVLDRFGNGAPRYLGRDLARAFKNRGAAHLQMPGDGTQAAIADFANAITILEWHIAVDPTRAPPEWRNELATAYLNSGLGKERLPGLGPQAAIPDYREAMRLWSASGILLDAQEAWFTCCHALAGSLVALDLHAEALGLMEEAGAQRLALVGSAVLAQEQASLLRASAFIPPLGAWLYAKAGRPADAVDFLAAQNGLMLKEALLRDPEALALRADQGQANELAHIRTRMHEVRHLLARPGDGAVAGELREELRHLAGRLAGVVAGLAPGFEQGLKAHDIAMLAPDRGVIVAPVVTKFGSSLLVLGGNDLVATRPLLELKLETIRSWALMLVEAEYAYLGVLRNRDENDDAKEVAAASFEASVENVSRSCWEGLVRPLCEFLDSSGFPPDAAITFVVDGYLDILPLHAACRDDGDRKRYLVEDRVVRYAPGFGALKLMASRKAAFAASELRVAGFFAPQPETLVPEDLPYALGPEQDALKRIVGVSLHPYPKSKATRDRLLGLLDSAARAPAFTDLHLSMHASFNVASPDLSYLLLVDDEGEWAPVTVSDLLRLRPAIGLRHVCLSSCQSGRSDPHAMPGEAIGLVGAFIQAGAASVLSALYSIQDASAADFVPRLYRHRMHGMDIAEAFRAEVCLRMRPGNPAMGSSPGLAIAGGGSRFGRDTAPQRQFNLLDWAAYKPSCA